jgi:hypothetical protein
MARELAGGSGLGGAGEAGVRAGDFRQVAGLLGLGAAVVGGFLSVTVGAWG